ncbi:hypothetical protein KDK88_08290, partial [bacterium]|nr:hypothetical protein [bacterium]
MTSRFPVAPLGVILALGLALAIAPAVPTQAATVLGQWTGGYPIAVVAGDSLAVAGYIGRILVLDTTAPSESMLLGELS